MFLALVRYKGNDADAAAGAHAHAEEGALQSM